MDINKIYHADCIEFMHTLPDNSIDHILTDPPYLYLKNQKLDREFDEIDFFNQSKRILKKDGFICLFGRGTSFYRWNTHLSDLGFTFKEEFIWNKNYCTSPLMSISRVHETISLHTKGKGIINKIKIPYLEMKGHDINAIVNDIKRLKTCFKNTKSLDFVLNYLENNYCEAEDYWHANNTTLSSDIHKDNRCVSVMKSIDNGMNEKSIIRTDYNKNDTYCKYSVTASNKSSGAGDRCVNVMNSMTQGMNEKSIIRTDYNKNDTFYKYGTTGSAGSAGSGDRCVDVMNSMTQGMNEKSIITEIRDHYTAIHPTQKPVRLLERLLQLFSNAGDIIYDPFAGSGATAIAAYNLSRNFICTEIDNEYYRLANNRIDEHIGQGKLF